MNEYQDQEVWYEVQCASTYKWITMADVDTREDAEDLLVEWLDSEPHSDHEHRIIRRAGIA